MDHKRNVSDGVVSGIGTLFSLDHKRKATPSMGRLNLILILSDQKVLDTGPMSRFISYSISMKDFFNE